MKRPAYRIIFFIGWLLSPLTFWNDAFVNIPLAYILSCITINFFPASFLAVNIIYYWLTNIAGIALMVASGRQIFRDRAHVRHEISMLILTLILYSTALILLDKFGILKPVKLI